MVDLKHEYGRAFEFPGGKHGCLLIHGFTGTPGQMRFIGERLRDEGYWVLAPLLPGHGATLEQMNASNWHEWLNTARTSYQQLREKCETVSVIGLSMGGALALIIAEEYPVDSLVCLSAAIKTRQRFTGFARLAALFQPIKRWEPHDWEADRDFMTEYDFGYDGIPVAKVYDLRKLSRLAERNLFAVVAPTLVIQPDLDETVDPISARIIMKGIRSDRKELAVLDKSSHVCTLDLEREQVMSLILKHLRHIDATK